MYELLFRSRWYALAWALLMAVSAIAFTTTGAGAWLTGIKPDPRASEEVREHQFSAWAEDDKRRVNDDQGFDPSSPEVVRDGERRRSEADDPAHRTAPFEETDSETDDTEESQ